MSLVADARMLGHSGIGTYVANVLPRIAALRPGRVRAIGDPAALARLSWPDGAKPGVVDCRSPIFSLREQLELPRRIPADCEVLWSPQFNIPLAYRGRLVVTIHDVLHIALPQYMKGLHRRLYARTLLAAVRHKANRIICDSRFTADELGRLVGIRSARIDVIPIGVDESWFSANPGARPPRPYFVFVGNVKAHKNVVGLIRAFREVAPKLPHDLVIVGKKQGFITGDRSAEAMAAELGERVRFTGLVEDAEVKRCVAGAEALVLPSFYEGFGLPPLEAMACGCPTIVSAVASLPEVCGDAALYCDPHDAADIAARMIEVATDEALRAMLRAKGMERARRFTWDKCARETLQVLEHTAA
ncbi:MAG: glycosyltransferase family 4 protein [Burkholderiales bacterium]